MSRRSMWISVVLLGCAGAGTGALYWKVVWRFMREGGGPRTVLERVEAYGPSVRARLACDFERIGGTYPPREITVVGLKDEKRLEVWVGDKTGRLRLLKTYPILAASGVLGPKLREGDRQVPEGLYRIESLNPNSLFHLALRVNYPNALDRAKGVAEGRSRLGGDIMIHGGSRSVGCLAMGDAAAEDLFVLVALAGIEHVSVILSPVDFRVRELPPDMPETPKWMREVYEEIGQALSSLK